MRSTIPVHKRPARNALTVEFSCVNYSSLNSTLDNLGETPRIGHRLVPESAGILSVIGIFHHRVWNKR
jgi:hypothetical protein